ncbi:MAG: ACP S-malonyltransferase [Syntrophorhabdaceae bacterium]|nr:ACP S-malonyltransferase [Syntrophorhabdaceae bacterium]
MDMKRIAVVFPGQGSQYVGMGKVLFDGFEEIRSLFKKADEVLGFSITKLCFEGPEEDLRQTYNTQPALFLIGFATWQVFKDKTGLRPSFVAGHSLGEYTALAASGFFTFEDGLKITRTRGMLMEEACPKGKGGMAALIGADMEKISTALKEISREGHIVVPANLNSAEQVVISGHIEAVREAVEKLKGTGYKKAVFLNVSGPFHSPLMEDAAYNLKIALNGITPARMEIPVFSNVDAEPEMDEAKVKEKLYRQMFSPVLWEKSVRNMVDRGVELFIEVGPQKVLTNLIKKIAPSTPCYNVETPEDMEKIMGVIG